MDYDTEQRRYRFELLDPLDDIRMSPSDREQARATMEFAEWTADLLVFAANRIQAIGASLAGAGINANFQREAFFSKATDTADLERRIRRWERQTQSLFG
jgi:hypothetical protein